ncbi:beta-1,3-galactosyltransferase 2-like [Stigmatopora nigra]
MRLKRRRCFVQASKVIFLFSLVALLIVLIKHIAPNIGVAVEKRHQKDKSKLNTTISLWKDFTGKENISSHGGESIISITSVKTFENLKPTNSKLIKSVDFNSDGLFPYLINEPDKCKGSRTAPFLVFLITTEALQVEAREAMRQTWANERLVPEVAIVRLFLLGKHEGPLTSNHQKILSEESQKYHDIIQQDFLDSYYNLTLKTLMGLHWVAHYCSEANYVMKTDSDMFVNTDRLIHRLLIPEQKPKRNYFTGHVIRNESPNQDKNNKAYVPREEYSKAKFPAFCSGTGYVLSGDLAPRIYTASLSLHQVHLEDVNMGLCLAKLGLEPTNPPDGLFYHWRKPYIVCEYNKLITSHGFEPKEIIKYWRRMQSDKTRCELDKTLLRRKKLK